MNLYATTATLQIHETYPLRRLLAQNGFMIRLHNRITGEMSAIAEDYEKESEAIAFFDDTLYDFACTYSSFSTPLPFRIVEQIRKNPRVTSYNDSKMNYGK